MIKVLIVDDSALVRQMLTEIIGAAEDIEVVDAVMDPFAAREKIKQLNPDVITLDVEMPKMDGVTFLSNLMRLRPMPVVMISTLTEKGADITFRALELGAVDFIAKPKVDVVDGLKEYGKEIVDKIRMAATAKVKPLMAIPDKNPSTGTATKTIAAGHFRTTDRIIGIGSSTGGTEAIKDVLNKLPSDMPGIVISQHIPANFSRAFAQRVNTMTSLQVSEAKHGQQIMPGHVLIAPGDRHLLVKRDGARYVCHLDDGPAVNRHKPSVDVMFHSLAKNAGSNAIAVMLTGMGADGAEGMGEMKKQGASTLAQDEKTSVVWGMPGEVVKRGFADKVLPLGKIAEELVKLATK